MNNQFFSVLAACFALSACGGGGGGSGESADLVSNESGVDTTTSVEPGQPVVPSPIPNPVVEPESESESESESAPESTPEPEPVPPTDSDTELSETGSEPLTDVESDPTAGPVETPETPATSEPSPIVTGNSNTIPFCVEAGQRIQSSVELGMTAEQVRALVGKPLDIDGSGTFWNYSRRTSTPEVRFQPVLTDNGQLGPGLVIEWDSQTDRCDNEDDALIEAANALALESPGPDRTNETGECAESGIRILAFVEQGMTPEKVRELIGKPIEISGSGTFWEYGESSSTPEVRFTATLLNGALSPGLVSEYDAEIHGCN